MNIDLKVVVPKMKFNIEIIIKMVNPRQEPQAFSNAPNWDKKDKDVLCNFKIKIEPNCQTWVYQIPVTLKVI